MSTTWGLSDITPPGAGIELVDENDSAVIPRVLAIEASTMGEANRIVRKYHDYRIWDQLQSLDSHPEVLPALSAGSLTSRIQKPFSYNEDDSDFADGVESVTLTFPKSAQSKITAQLAKFPPSLPLLGTSHPKASGRSIHVGSRTGNRSLPILEQPLDIEVTDSSYYICLNNPASPSWMVVTPRNHIPMLFMPNLRAVNAIEISEKAAWDEVSLWFESRGVIATAVPYPQGANSFPDFTASIDGQAYDVEMTSVPDMKNWTIKGTFRKLEDRIREIARLPGQTRAEVIDEFMQKVSDKHEIAKRASVNGEHPPCILVLSNWSAHSLASVNSDQVAELSFFALVMLIEADGVHVLHSGHDM